MNFSQRSIAAHKRRCRPWLSSQSDDGGRMNASIFNFLRGLVVGVLSQSMERMGPGIKPAEW